jgi:hypothetical protein
MDKLIGDTAIDAITLAALRKGGTWAAYQNIALDSADAGRFQFLKYGPGCTHERPPVQMPDHHLLGPGWKYRHVGFADLATGQVVEKEP